MKCFMLIAILFVITACSIKEHNASGEGVPTIKYLASPAKASSSVPYLFTDKKGVVYLSWIEQKGSLNVFKWSKLQADQWSQPKDIASGDSWFVNWADYPMIAANGDANFISHILDKSGEGAYAYDIKMFSSTDGGNNWHKPFVLHSDAKKAEHGFLSLVPYDEKIFVCWLDGRNTAVEEMDHSSMDEGGHQGAMTLRAAFIDYAGNKIHEWELDDKTCDCCQTTAVITDNGPIVVYRDRSDDEIRDLSIVRFIDGKWTRPQAVSSDHWKISGCPVNGPRADAIGKNISVAWFTAPEGRPKVNVIFSDDAGATFGSPIRVDEAKPNGRVDVAQLDKRSCLVSWMEDGNIKVVKVYSDGSKDASVTIANSTEARASGFPQMTLAENEVIFAWTDDKEKTVKVASIGLE